MFILNASVKCNRYFFTSSKHGRITTSKIQFYLFIITASCQDWICNCNYKRIRNQTYTFLTSSIYKVYYLIQVFLYYFKDLHCFGILLLFHGQYLDKKITLKSILDLLYSNTALWVSCLYYQTNKANLPKLPII